VSHNNPIISQSCDVENEKYFSVLRFSTSSFYDGNEATLYSLHLYEFTIATDKSKMSPIHFCCFERNMKMKVGILNFEE
jgi:hypothetical protein